MAELWFNSIGWKMYRRLMAGAITGVFLVKGLQQLSPDMHKSYVELIDAPEIPPEHISLGKEIAQQMKIKNPEKIKLFYHAGFKSNSAGHVNLPGGAVIGIPRPFMFTSEEEIRESVVFCDREIDWDNKAGVIIQQLMIPNEHNLRFVLLHELYNVSRDFDLKEEILVCPAFLGCGFAIGEFVLRNSQNVGKIPMYGPFALFIIYALSLGAYMKVISDIRHSRVYTADKFAAEFDKRAGMGGINYLGRLIKKNQILKVLHGNDEEIYTSQGDELFKVNANPPLTKRVRKLEETLGFKKIKIPSLF